MANVFKTSGFVVSPGDMQWLFDISPRLFRLWKDAGLPCRPKLHHIMHLVQRSELQGNPAYYATWEDEGLNKVLGQLGRAAHRSVWEVRILAHFDAYQTLIRDRPKRQRRA